MSVRYNPEIRFKRIYTMSRKDIISAFKVFLQKQAEVTRASDDPEATLDVFHTIIMAMDLWYSTPRRGLEDVEPDAVMDCLKKLEFFRKKLSAPTSKQAT